ncbi:MAG: flagellin [Candidatus Thermoplasmatota archaeon]
MKSFSDFLKKKDVGAIGIGAMIVFIAMVLVAGVAATVLVSTSNTIQNQAMKTGQQTTREVSSGLTVFQILGHVNVTNGTYYDMDKLAVVVTAKPGSGEIDLNVTHILISDGSKKALLRYGGYNRSGLWVGSITGALFDSITDWTNITKETFGLGVLQDFDGSMTQTNPVLNRGDKAVIFLRCSSNDSGLFGSEISERKDISGRVVPEVGAPGIISFTSPKAYSDTIYKLQ